jgi:hypothetical protein
MPWWLWVLLAVLTIVVLVRAYVEWAYRWKSKD